MSWIQVYVSGLSRTVDPSDEDIESHLNIRYSLSASSSEAEVEVEADASININILWGGPGTTLIKRDGMGSCRGFGFLAFYSTEGASTIVNRINAYSQGGAGAGGAGAGGLVPDDDMSVLPLQLHAELSNPKLAKDKKKTKKQQDSSQQQDHATGDLRLRHKRGKPIRKHPVIVSSSGKKTNLGNKNK
jgi:hypothetical protein